MHKEKYLCILFCVTAGQNEEFLGCDETEIINITSMIIGTQSCQVYES